MRNILIAAAATATLLLAGVGVASAAADPTCGEAIASLTDTRAKATATQAELDKLEKAQIPLDKAEAAGQKLVDEIDEETPAAEVTKRQNDLLIAGNAAAAGQKLVDTAKGNDDNADKKVADAQAAVTKACGAVPPAEVDDRVCADFGTNKAAAQAAYLAGNTKLDGDADGVACEEQIVKKPTVAPATGAA